MYWLNISLQQLHNFIISVSHKACFLQVVKLFNFLSNGRRGHVQYMEAAAWVMNWVEILSCFTGGCIFCVSSARGTRAGAQRAGPRGPSWESLWREGKSWQHCQESPHCRIYGMYCIQRQIFGKKSGQVWKDIVIKSGIALNSCVFSFSFEIEGPLPLAQKNVEKNLWFEIHIRSFYIEWRCTQHKRDSGRRGERRDFLIVFRIVLTFYSEIL